ncbi:type II secretion system protein [Candidatus Saccharibacteria bacterium]|nr:type II secretion system protein [Candidatus Saccharibacteria bacterium]
MNLQNKTKQSGFTIVELLIVIVVIAILAAITIVAYNGIQNRAKTSSAQSLASNVAKKAEAFNTIESSYPANNTSFNATGAPAESRLDDAAAVTGSTTALPTDEKTVKYVRCGTGAKVVYRSAAENTHVVIGVGGANTAALAGSGNTTTPYSC